MNLSTRNIVPVAIGAGLVLAALWLLGWIDPGGTEPVYRRIEVPVERIVEVESVDTIVEWRERVVYRTVEAEQVATSDTGGEPDVATFCEAAVADARREDAPDSTRATSPPSLPARLLIRSARHDPGWFFSRDKLILTGPLSDGRLRQLRYSLRPGYRWHVMADSLLVQEPRMGFWRELVEGIVYGAIGYAVGRL